MGLLFLAMTVQLSSPLKGNSSNDIFKFFSGIIFTTLLMQISPLPYGRDQYGEQEKASNRNPLI
jgi:hypothetical protein